MIRWYNVGVGKVIFRGSRMSKTRNSSIGANFKILLTKQIANIKNRTIKIISAFDPGYWQKTTVLKHSLLISNIMQNAFLSFIGQPCQISSLLNMCRKSGKGLCTTKLCAWKTCAILYTNIFLSYVTELQQKPPQSATPPTSVSSWCELFAENLAFTY